MATIEKRGQGYRITVSYGYRPDGTQQRYREQWDPPQGLTARQTEKELAREAVLFEERVRNGSAATGAVRLRDFADTYMTEYVIPTLKRNTAAGYERDLKKIVAELGVMKLQAIKPGHITRFYAKLFAQGTSPESISAINRTFSALLGKAVRWGYIPSSPIANAERPKCAAKEARYFDEPDARRLLELLYEEPIKWRALITFDLLSGLRRGELLGLRWRDVDFNKHTIEIRQTWNMATGRGVYVDTPKTATSRRPLMLTTAAFSLLEEYRRWQDGQRAALGDAWRGSADDDRVFTRDDGAPMYPTSPTQWFSKFIGRSGLPSASLHSLRHTYASLMIADKVPIIVVSGQLGHAKTSTTVNIYGHMIASAQAAAAETFDRFSDVVSRNKPQINPTGTKPQNKTKNKTPETA